MLHFLHFHLKENSQTLCPRVVITLKPFNFVQSFLSLDSLVPRTVLFLKPLYNVKWPEQSCFWKKGFEVCLLSRVFAVIIRLHIKVQTHLMLEVTENCYHLMALWAELSQTTRHAPNALFLGITPGDLKRLGNTDCTFPRVASWAINLTVIALWPWAVGVIPVPSSVFFYFRPFRVLISYLSPTYLSVGTREALDEVYIMGAILITLSTGKKNISESGFLGRGTEKWGRETG